MLQQRNTQKQGDAGLGAAIGWYAGNGLTVAVPLTDSQSYDLIVDDGQLLRVQVKTTTYKQNNAYVVNMAVKGWSTRTKKCKIKKFDDSQADEVFIVTGGGDMYRIPATAVAGNNVRLTKKFDKYKV